MSRTMAKVLIRAFGSLCGLSGAFTLCLTMMMSVELISSPELWRWAFLGFFLAMGVYLVYFAYLVWFRFSSRAVRHACGVLGVFLLSFVPELLNGHEDSPLGIGLFLGSLVLVYLGYKSASTRLNRWLFPDSIVAQT